MTLTLSDPMVLKAGGGVALYLFGGSRLARMGGIALAAWAAWDYYQRQLQPAPVVVGYDVNAQPLLNPLTAPPSSPPPAAVAATDAPADDQGGKVIPLHRHGLEERDETIFGNAALQDDDG